jgi:hypothetical protein
LLALVWLWLSSTLLFAESAAASLRGSVSDASGAALVGARVILQCAERGFSSERRTDGNGGFQFHQLGAGNYTVTVEAAGFSRQGRRVELLVNQPATVNFSLTVQSQSTVVDVSAERAELNSVDASMGDAVDHETIEALPIEGRNVPELLSLQPGVVYLGSQNDQSHDSRSGSTLGGRSDQGNITLDGVEINDQVRGYAFTGVLRPTLDSVEEFRVTTAGFGAEMGRSSGAQISLVTKSGTNNLHGSLYEYNRTSLGEANDWFNKQAELASGQPNQPGKLIRNTFGASLGAPIQKDKTFFFANYEGQRTSEDQQETLTVPTASMRAGNILYPGYVNGAVQTVTLSQQQIAAMDTGCTANGTCPWGPGANPNVLAVLNQYPLPNGKVAGDGLNTGSFTWAAPAPAALNTYVLRLDRNFSSANRLFVRGNLQNDKVHSAPEFPGQPASSITWDNSKGVAVGETWELSSTFINSVHYGFTRQGYASRGIGQGQYASFYNISPLYAETRSTIVDVPVHNLVDDITWVHKAHTTQFGVNYALIHNHRRSDAMSYSYGYTNSYALANAGIAGTCGSLDPAAFGLPAVAGSPANATCGEVGNSARSFVNSYNFAMANLTGLLDLVTTQANYQISRDGQSANLLPAGAMLDREFKNSEFEYYVQDSWKLRPGLMLYFGARHTLLQTPYEIHGQQVQPTVDIDRWFKTRAEQAALGNSVQPDLYFAPSGQARGSKSYWPMSKGNIAPRIAVAYSPAPQTGFFRRLFGGAEKSSLRAGYGIYYDHFGEGIVNSFDQFGSFGLSESITNPTNVLTVDTSPRFTGMHDLPNITGTPASAVSYPVLAPNNPLWTGFEIVHGLDDRMKTPYSHVVNVSFQRELPGRFLAEIAYVGRFGRNQLQQIDLAEPLDLVDPISGQDYFAAATALSRQAYAGAVDVAAIPYFEHMFPDAAGGGKSATQNIYSQVWLPGNETASLYMLDILCTPGCGGRTNRFWQRQYASMYAWASIGSSNYNAAQLSLRRKANHVQVELNYTFAKSMDMGSDAERTIFSSSTGTSNGSSFGAILNAWKPRLNYAPSDFDVRHLITGNWIVDLPFGRGRRFFGGSSEEMDQVIGGWQIAGLARWTSGLPFSIISGTGWGTDWDEKSNMVQTGHIHTHTHIDSTGEPQVFAGESANSLPLRNPYPGEAGDRNNLRGDGYFGVDASLSKSWTLAERGKLRFAWEVFNVTNTVRFDVNPLTSLQNMTTSGELGVYGATLTRPRIQQFSLRYAY